MEQNIETKENKKEQSLPKRILSIVFNVLFYALIVLLFLFALSNIRSKGTNIPNIFGYGYLTVNSDSMKKSDGTGFVKGDVILVKVLDAKKNKKAIENLEVGDVVTFYDVNLQSTLTDMGISERDTTYLNTHRLVDKYEKDGVTYYITQGDYLIGTADEYHTNEEHTGNKIQVFTADKIRGVYVKTFGKGLTGALNFLHTQSGFGLCIVLPTALLLIFEVVVLVMNLLKMNKEKMQKQLAVQQEQQTFDLEAERERMRAQLLAEMEAEKNKAKEAEAKPAEDAQKEEPQKEEPQPEESAEEPQSEESAEEPQEAENQDTNE